MLRAWTLYPWSARIGSHGRNMEAQPKPPWQKRMGDWRTCGERAGLGVALRSSRGPEGVEMKERVMPVGRGVGGGEEEVQERVQRCEEGRSGAGMAHGLVLVEKGRGYFLRHDAVGRTET
jgi:hypothetical protein